MDVKELKVLIEDYPDDMVVFVQSPIDLHIIEHVEEGQNCLIIYTK